MASVLGPKRFADSRIARLDSGINEVDTFLVGQKSAFHCVDRDFLKVVQRQSKGVRGGFEFLGHRGVAHQPIIGVQRDAEFFLVKNLEWMLGQLGVAPV